MKYIIFFLLFPFCLAAQQFTGVGPIKVNENESKMISSLQQEFGNQLEIYTKKNATRIENEWTSFLISSGKANPKIYKLENKKDYSNWPTAYGTQLATKLADGTEDYSFYYIPKYYVGDIALSEIYITCSKSAIQVIEINWSSELVKAAGEKYPPSYKFDTTYTIKCKYVYTGAFKEELVIKHEALWDSTTKTTSVGSLEYSSDCKPVPISKIEFASKEFLESLKKKWQKESEEKSKADDANKQKIKDKI